MRDIAAAPPPTTSCMHVSTNTACKAPHGAHSATKQRRREIKGHESRKPRLRNFQGTERHPEQGKYRSPTVLFGAAPLGLHQRPPSQRTEMRQKTGGVLPGEQTPDPECDDQPKPRCDWFGLCFREDFVVEGVWSRQRKRQHSCGRGIRWLASHPVHVCISCELSPRKTTRVHSGGKAQSCGCPHATAHFWAKVVSAMPNAAAGERGGAKSTL